MKVANQQLMSVSPKILFINTMLKSILALNDTVKLQNLFLYKLFCVEVKGCTILTFWSRAVNFKIQI